MSYPEERRRLSAGFTKEMGGRRHHATEPANDRIRWKPVIRQAYLKVTCVQRNIAKVIPLDKDSRIKDPKAG
jgi:hypothetical protein